MNKPVFQNLSNGRLGYLLKYLKDTVYKDSSKPYSPSYLNDENGKRTDTYCMFDLASGTILDDNDGKGYSSFKDCVISFENKVEEDLMFDGVKLNYKLVPAYLAQIYEDIDITKPTPYGDHYDNDYYYGGHDFYMKRIGTLAVCDVRKIDFNFSEYYHRWSKYGEVIDGYFVHGNQYYIGSYKKRDTEKVQRFIDYLNNTKIMKIYNSSERLPAMWACSY